MKEYERIRKAIKEGDVVSLKSEFIKLLLYGYDYRKAENSDKFPKVISLVNKEESPISINNPINFDTFIIKVMKEDFVIKLKQRQKINTKGCANFFEGLRKLIYEFKLPIVDFLLDKIIEDLFFCSSKKSLTKILNIAVIVYGALAEEKKVEFAQLFLNRLYQEKDKLLSWPSEKSWPKELIDSAFTILNTNPDDKQSKANIKVIGDLLFYDFINWDNKDIIKGINQLIREGLIKGDNTMEKIYMVLEEKFGKREAVEELWPQIAAPLYGEFSLQLLNNKLIERFIDEEKTDTDIAKSTDIRLPSDIVLLIKDHVVEKLSSSPNKQPGITH